MPSFYKAWNKHSLIFKLLDAIGKILDESDKDLDAILRSHWVDTAFNIDLDKLASIFNMTRKSGESDSLFRTRIKRAIIEFKGGGTINAILSSIRLGLRLPNDYPLKLIENPPKKIVKIFEVRAGQTWRISANSISNAVPTITVNVKTEGAKVVNPTIINLASNASLTFNGELHSGETLILSKDGAFLDDTDVSDKLSGRAVPYILRGGSDWKYVESLEKNIGLFDVARFDDSIFAVGISTVSIKFEWIAYQPATFELHIPDEALMGHDPALVKEIINSTKAAGVNAIIKIMGGV